MKILPEQNCSFVFPDVFEDHRGIIRSYYPDENIVEWNLMITKKNDSRGYHYHPEFVEYMTVVDGKCMFFEFSNGKKYSCELNIGDSIRIPIGTPHAFVAIEDFKFVSLLTKKWNDCNPPIIKVNNDGKPL